jgi:dipeptidyl aminopeptidase/acylaminoacyl peptidase
VRGARLLLGLAGVLALVSALLVVLTWLGMKSLERGRLAETTMPRPARAGASEPGTGADVSYRSRGARIAARLHLPRDDGPHPALVVAHGSGPSRRSQYDDMAAHLAARGWALLVYDKRGVGESEGDYSSIGPANSEAMFDLLAADVVAGVEYLAARADIDSKRIGVLGISQGGWIGPLAATRSPAVSFLVIVSGPVVSVGEEIYYSELTGEREGGDALVTDGDLAAELAAFSGPHGFDPVPVLERLDVPGLWILGAGDRSIPVPETVTRLEGLIAAGRPFTLRVLPDVGHGMRHVATGEPVPVTSIAADWLDARASRSTLRR